MKTILFIIVGILSLATLSFFLYVCYLFWQALTDEDSEFPNGGTLVDPNDKDWFYNFYKFKKLVYYFAEKDEEIKKYLMDRKSRFDSVHTNISDSDVDGKTNSKDVSSDI